MELKVDITDEALITALNAVGEIVVKNASESLLGTSLRPKKQDIPSCGTAKR